jgi:L-amino acid N-acyltransferase YncA
VAVLSPHIVLDPAEVLISYSGVDQAARSDLPSMTEIYNAAVRERSATADDVQRSIGERGEWFDGYRWSEGCPLIVVRRAGRVVGYAGATHFRAGKSGYDGCLEVSLYVAAAARGEGCGRLLGQAVAHAAKALGNRLLLALVFSDNASSNGLFAHLGFQLCAHLPHAVMFPDDAPMTRDVGIWQLQLR